MSAAAGCHPVAGAAFHGARDYFHAVDPSTGEKLDPAFPDADEAAVSAAVGAAAAAAHALAAAPGRRVAVLRAIADDLDADADGIVAVADREAGLGETRLRGEVGRTSGQLRAFAALVEDGSYVEAVIDHGDPGATPPRPDLRRHLVPIGPVAVFGASNFPLAFSVAGGDTASALAAGCPVVVKGHPAHPATGSHVARIVADAITRVGLPAGSFSLVHVSSPDAARPLIEAPALRGIGFTGSLRAGRAIHDLAAARPTPIPVFAEMGSLNPVVVAPRATASRTRAIAEGFVGSMSLGGGQFCTKPGLLFVPDGDDGDALVAAAADAVHELTPPMLLTPGIRDACAARTDASAGLAPVTELARAAAPDPGVRTDAVLLSVPADALAEHPELLEEHFGPTAIVVRYADRAGLLDALAHVPGSLTACLFADASERAELGELVAVLSELAGRLVFDGFPTGVAVSPAMQHGGPYPASTDPRFGAVGTGAIRRWLRPVAYQDAPAALVPPALADGNPLGLWREVDGCVVTDPGSS